MTHTTFSIQPDEQVLLQVRKHWFMFARDAGGVLLVGIFLPLIMSIALGMVGEVSNTVAALFIFFIAAWLLAIWISIAILWTNHYLDMWVITDHRIIHVEQKHLFVREAVTLSLERVQDARVLYNGFIETVLDFGTIHVQSAGADQNEIFMHGMPTPNDVKRIILDLVDTFREAHVYTRTPEDTRWHEKPHEGTV